MVARIDPIQTFVQQSLSSLIARASRRFSKNRSYRWLWRKTRVRSPIHPLAIIIGVK